MFQQMNELANSIRRRELSLADDLYKFLTPDGPEESAKIFGEVVVEGLHNFEKHYPLIIETRIPSNPYIFRDNFPAFLEGNISEKEVILVPEVITNVRAGRFAPLTANNYHYHKPELTGVMNAYEVTYITHYPIVQEITEDGYSERSGVYMLPSDVDFFIDSVSYCVLSKIVHDRNAVRLGSGVEFFDLQDRLAELKADLEEDYANSPAFFESSWR